MNTIRQPVSVFYSYHEKDGHLRDRLDDHLAALERLQLIRGWHRRDIRAGTELQDAIDEHLNAAHIILLLISNYSGHLDPLPNWFESGTVLV